MEHGQPVNSVLDGVLPLHAACAGGNVQVVKVLIDHGADVNAPRYVSTLPQNVFTLKFSYRSAGFPESIQMTEIGIRPHP